ncbi:MAG: hypothetical protein JWN57_2619 [Frankiales bacterium]|nr:hypothetical protein [Frankiales bacterium]
MRAGVRTIGELLITIGLIGLLFCVYELEVTSLYTDRQQAALRDELARSWAEPTAVPGHAVPPAAIGIGAALAVVRAPRLGADWRQVVLEGISVADLKRGPGHDPGTALPGQIGNVVVSGHRTTYGAPFENLDRLVPGDPIVVETRDSWFTYRVTGTLIVRPDQIEVTAAVPGRPGVAPAQRLLTLTTCHPKYSARARLVVQARLQGGGSKVAGQLPAALTGRGA